MIDQQLIDNAIMIRKEFLELDKSLENHQNSVRGLSDYLMEVAAEIENHAKNIKSKDTINGVQAFLMGKMNDIESKTKEFEKKMSPIIERMEMIKKEEQLLYNTIVERYPDMKTDEIIAEIQRQIPS